MELTSTASNKSTLLLSLISINLRDPPPCLKSLKNRKQHKQYLPHKTTYRLWERLTCAEPPPPTPLLSQVNNQSSNVECHVQRITILLSLLVND